MLKKVCIRPMLHFRFIILCIFRIYVFLRSEPQVRTPLTVQGLRLHAPRAGGPGSVPGQGNRSYMLQLKDPQSQISNFLKRKKK